jgi:hypothetical protein
MHPVADLFLCIIAIILGQQAASSPALETFARGALHDANASGFIQVRDVLSDRVLVHVSTGERDGAALGIDAPVVPLSVIKVYVAAAWLEHGFGDVVVDCAPSGGHPLRRMRVEDVLSSGCDSAGADMAVMLRRKLGAARVLQDLRRYGLDHVTLPPDASDAHWGAVLSLGEEEVTVTPRQVSAFLRAVGHGDPQLFSSRTAHRLRAALDGVVQHGTGASIKDVLAGTRWHLGGKTGTGPGQCGDHCDGWFASLLSDRGEARYVILVFIQAKGLGGGLAARTAAAIARQLMPIDDNASHH